MSAIEKESLLKDLCSTELFDKGKFSRFRSFNLEYEKDRYVIQYCCSSTLVTGCRSGQQIVTLVTDCRSGQQIVTLVTGCRSRQQVVTLVAEQLSF